MDSKKFIRVYGIRICSYCEECDSLLKCLEDARNSRGAHIVHMALHSEAGCTGHEVTMTVLRRMADATRRV
jgi:hypothetical protein